MHEDLFREVNLPCPEQTEATLLSRANYVE